MKLFITICFLLSASFVGADTRVDLSESGFTHVKLKRSYAIEADQLKIYLDAGKPVSYRDRNYAGYYCEIYLHPSNLPRVLMPNTFLPIKDVIGKKQNRWISSIYDRLFNQYVTINIEHEIVKTIQCIRFDDDQPFLWELDGVFTALSKNRMVLTIDPSDK